MHAFVWQCVHDAAFLVMSLATVSYEAVGLVRSYKQKKGNTYISYSTSTVDKMSTTDPVLVHSAAQIFSTNSPSLLSSCDLHLYGNFCRESRFPVVLETQEERGEKVGAKRNSISNGIGTIIAQVYIPFVPPHPKKGQK